MEHLFVFIIIVIVIEEEGEEKEVEAEGNDRLWTENRRATVTTVAAVGGRIDSLGGTAKPYTMEGSTEPCA